MVEMETIGDVVSYGDRYGTNESEEYKPRAIQAAVKRKGKRSTSCSTADQEWSVLAKRAEPGVSAAWPEYESI